MMKMMMTRMNGPSSGHGHLRYPAERFYWAMLDTSLLEPRHRRDPSRLKYLVEPLLPVALDEVHVAFRRVDATRTLACAIERSVLEHEVLPSAITLHPAAPPEHFAEHDASVDQLNLLSGRYTPPVITRLTRSMMLRAAAAGILIAILLCLGLERRAQRHRAHAAAVNVLIDEVYESVLGPTPAGSAAPSGQPRELRLLAERRGLEQTRREVNLPAAEIADVAAELEALLHRWPNEHHLSTETITLTPRTITVRAALPMEEAQGALDSFRTWGDWRRQQPEISNQRGVATFTVRFTRPGEGGGS